MKMFVYVVVNHEKVFLGVFEDPETIYEDVEVKLSNLGFSQWAEKYPIYMMGAQKEPYRLLWEDEK
ncbi:hypothetical protein [Enterococcus gilvus]|uniref:Uncharacterized protein n=1 Tax=Enterococcus gilvus ATCC BAA-350 TaxID=1158614 RepID=R2VI23_9ENTE|nr:hypothetical protein [Enterococcus gilvus]EOI57296.1 hypothetical protein UKC_01510 [Enterococcus gilvus ATCC BAA-350]EOW83130.1 hypothetical protein I592_02457 [Enterococcus gilvus ATCC BAA-350]